LASFPIVSYLDPARNYPFVGSLLLSHGYRWGVALFAVAALIFWVAWSRIPDYVHRGVRVRGRR
jgi:hypothetical protein